MSTICKIGPNIPKKIGYDDDFESTTNDSWLYDITMHLNYTNKSIVLYKLVVLDRVKYKIILQTNVVCINENYDFKLQCIPIDIATYINRNVVYSKTILSYYYIYVFVVKIVVVVWCWIVMHYVACVWLQRAVMFLTNGIDTF